MSDALERLENRIRQLGERLEALRAENENFRRHAGGGEQSLNSQQALHEIDSLRREKRQLQKKIERIDQGLSRLIEQIDQLQS